MHRYSTTIAWNRVRSMEEDLRNELSTMYFYGNASDDRPRTIHEYIARCLPLVS